MAGSVSFSELLCWIDPRELPPEVQGTLQLIGPSLAREKTLTEIAHEHGRRKDWAADRVAELRAAILAQVAGHVDEMSPGLRARVLVEIGKLPPPRVRKRRRSRAAVR